MKKIVKRVNLASSTAELYIYDEIGFFGIDAKAAVEEIKALGDVSRIDLHVNSPGGVISDGIAIYNAIRRHKATVTTYVDGLAASIASVIALAGDKVVMAEGSLFMIHDPWSMAIGSAEDFRKEADVLDTHKETIVGIYENATGKGRDEISAMMLEETWMRGQEAVDAGFASEVEGQVKAAAWANRDAAKEWYSKTPDCVEDCVEKDITDNVATFSATCTVSGNDTVTRTISSAAPMTDAAEDSAEGGAGISEQETPPHNSRFMRQAVIEKLITIKNNTLERVN